MRLMPAPAPSRVRASCGAELLDFREAAGLSNMAGLELHGVGMGAAPLTSRATSLPANSSTWASAVAWRWRFGGGAAIPLGAEHFAVFFALRAFATGKLKRARPSSADPGGDNAQVSSTPPHLSSHAAVGTNDGMCGTRPSGESDGFSWNFGDNFQLALEVGGDLDEHYRARI